jgi:hypothetical protein
VAGPSRGGELDRDAIGRVFEGEPPGVQGWTVELANDLLPCLRQVLPTSFAVHRISDDRMA